MGLEELKEHIETALAKLKSDPQMLESFKKDPIKTIEGVLGLKLPEGQVKEIAEAVKVKLGAEHLGDMVKGLGGLFKK